MAISEPSYRPNLRVDYKTLEGVRSVDNNPSPSGDTGGVRTWVRSNYTAVATYLGDYTWRLRINNTSSDKVLTDIYFPNDSSLSVGAGLSSNLVYIPQSSGTVYKADQITSTRVTAYLTRGFRIYQSNVTASVTASSDTVTTSGIFFGASEKSATTNPLDDNFWIELNDGVNIERQLIADNSGFNGQTKLQTQDVWTNTFTNASCNIYYRNDSTTSSFQPWLVIADDTDARMVASRNWPPRYTRMNATKNTISLLERLTINPGETYETTIESVSA